MKKVYTNQVKEKVYECLKKTESISSISKTTGISRSTIYRWKRSFETCQMVSPKQHDKTIKKMTDKLTKSQSLLEIVYKCGVGTNASLQQKLYAMEKLYKQYPTRWICEAMKVDRGTFYNHVLRNKKENTVYNKQRNILKQEILKIYNDSHQIYGCGKIYAILKEKGYITSEKTVLSIMQEEHIQSIRQKSKLFYCTERKNSLKNILKQDFNATKPNQIWVSDVTTYFYKDKYYYICVIIDLFARKVVGYKISMNNSTHLTKATLKLAYISRNIDTPLIFHSDRGSNYTSKKFMSYLASLNITQSFSNPKNPYDNSVCEAFFSNFKKEELYRTRYHSERELLKAVDDYILFYNFKRPHSTNKYKTPNKKEEEYYLSIK